MENIRACGASGNGVAPSPRCAVSRASTAVQFGPATGSTLSKRTLNGPTCVRLSPAAPRPASRVMKALSAAMPASATAMPRCAITMPQMKSGVRRRLRPQSGATLAAADARRQHQAEQRQQADARREDDQREQHRGAEQDRQRQPVAERLEPVAAASAAAARPP